jgi:hypothetical protein
MTKIRSRGFHQSAILYLVGRHSLVIPTPPGHIGASIQRVVAEHLHAGERPRDYLLPLVPTLHVCVVTLHSRAGGALPPSMTAPEFPCA